LLGLACGDALGGPVEFRSQQEIAREFPDGLRDFVGGGWLDLRPGEVTDDTQLMLALGAALTRDGFEPSLFVDGLLGWYRTGPKDIGRTTRAALELLANGIDWAAAGEDARRAVGERAASNGALMRCAPVALRFRGDLARMVSASIDSARVTHADPRCVWSAVALNQAIGTLLAGESAEAALAAATVGIEDRAVVGAVRAVPGMELDAVRADGAALHTLAAALWCLLRYEGLEETVVAAVSLGEDADTTGAVAGALAGARYGLEAIPRRWLVRLERRAEIGALGERLHGLSEEGEDGKVAFPEVS
jgi:ADP-ribosyl-[dinitrogen reductase] hydrolase